MIPVVAAGRVLWTAARAGCAAAAHPLARGAATGLPEGAWTRASPSWPGCSGGRRVRGERRHEPVQHGVDPVSYTHLRAHETRHDLVCRLLLENKKHKKTQKLARVA